MIFGIYAFRSVLVLLVCLSLYAASSAQSADQNFPTPVRTSELVGTIKAREVGDSRLTSHFYTFEGGQGDLFINVQASNFTGDIDVFVVPGMLPLTKMVFYSDTAISETGRVIYLRKPETIILRVEGRSPNDEEASYRIKFAGGFISSRSSDIVPDVPTVKSEAQPVIRVNSVGTILETRQKPERSAAATENAESPADVNPAEGRIGGSGSASKVTSGKLQPKKGKSTETPSVVSSASTRKDKTAKSVPAALKERVGEGIPKTGAAKQPEEPQKNEPTLSRKSDRSAKSDTPAADQDSMININLIIKFKDGSRIERPMTEVFKFAVERAVLTVISMDGSIGRYPMSGVAGVTIE